MTDQLDRFETALLTELRSHVEERATVRSPRRGRRLVLAGLVAASVAGIAATTIGGTPGTTPTAVAYSTVSINDSGGVHLELNFRDDAETVERVLAEHGVNADVTFLAPYEVCDAARYADVVEDKHFGVVLGSHVENGYSIEIPRVPSTGETLLIDTTDGLPDVDAQHPNANHTWAGLVSGTVPDCVPVAAKGS